MPSYDGISFVAFELFDEGSSTRLKLTHAGLESIPDDPNFARKNFEIGWNSLMGTMLREYLVK